MEAFLQRLWYDGRGPAWLLWPLSLLFRGVSASRRRRQERRAGSETLSVPVVVVGNINVGGTGKTPLLIALAKSLTQAGLRPGIVSRGYGGNAPCYPFLVTPTSGPNESGDEALLISTATECPVVVDPDRLRAVRWLEAADSCDVVLSDDGLQHYRMPRTVEIAVIDGQRGLGNGFCLPAGPLREPPGRLSSVDFAVINGEPSPRLLRQLAAVSGLQAAVVDLQAAVSGLPAAVAGLQDSPVYHVALEPAQLRSLKPGQSFAPSDWRGPRQVHGVAGIGHPERFFATLESLGFDVLPHPFPDHHEFVAEDLVFGDGLPVLMTAKDAVKCRSFAQEHHWVLDVQVRIPEALLTALLRRLAPPSHSRRGSS